MQITYLFIFLQLSNSAGREWFPWHETVNERRSYMATEVFTTHPVMPAILQHFHKKWVYVFWYSEEHSNTNYVLDLIRNFMQQ